jgi:outer membrane protease
VLIVYKRVFLVHIIFMMQQYRYDDLNFSIIFKDVIYYVHVKSIRTPFVIITG